jgi:hypothetical protein
VNEQRQLFFEIVREISARPGMFGGSGKLRDVAIYLAGVEDGIAHGKAEMLVAPGWNRWVEGRFLIFSPAWHWSRILVYTFGSDQAALTALPALYEEFFADLDSLGADGIEKRATKFLVDKYGERFHEPDAR